MNEKISEKTDSPEQLSEILLVLDKEKMKIMAVKGIDEKGKLKTVEPTKKNQNQFMRVDKQGDLFSNFFTNFFSQLKNPTNFSFFNVPSPLAINTAKEMQKQVDHPTPEGDKLMKQHEVKKEPERIINKKIKIIWKQRRPLRIQMNINTNRNRLIGKP
jgi:hypothetical protein